jgi:hypothetical protein
VIYLYDLGYDKIKLKLLAHHLWTVEHGDIFNWVKRVEIGFQKSESVFKIVRIEGKGLNYFNELFTSFIKVTYISLITHK